MFIVEGADFVGKTTFLNQARTKINRAKWPRWYGRDVIKIQHWGRLPENFNYGQSYLDAVTKGGQLSDRFALSELAYGAAFRNGVNPKFTPHLRRLVARELNRAGSVQVLLRANVDSIARRMIERGRDDMCQTVGHYNAINQYYDVALKDLALGRRGVTYLSEIDTSDGNEDAVAQALTWSLDVWRMHLDRSMTITGFAPQSWGYLWPKILLVGEQVGGDITGMRPFAGFNGCSKTLSDLLDFAGVGERSLYLVNAYDNDGDELDPRAIIWLSPKIVIALGESAAKYLHKHNITHHKFPHPQYLRRFESQRLPEWGVRLRALVAGALMETL